MRVDFNVPQDKDGNITNPQRIVAALPTIITSLAQRGFQFVTIPRMIHDLPPQGTGSAQISPDQLSPEGAFSPYLTFPRSSTSVAATNAGWRKACFPSAHARAKPMMMQE